MSGIRKIFAAAVSGVLGCASGCGPARHAVGPSGELLVPPVNRRAAEAGFVDVRAAVPDALVDMRYSRPDNFVGKRLYPSDARCLVHSDLAPGLAAAAAALRAQGYTLVFWDCYRPHRVQVKMFKAVSNPEWVAKPGPYSRSHESGRSVDVSIARPDEACPAERRIGALCLADMGTGFDDFSPLAAAAATEGLGAEALANRARLFKAMEEGGLTVYSGEWWHFNGPGAKERRPIINVPQD